MTTYRAEYWPDTEKLFVFEYVPGRRELRCLGVHVKGVNSRPEWGPALDRRLSDLGWARTADWEVHPRDWEADVQPAL